MCKGVKWLLRSIGKHTWQKTRLLNYCADWLHSYVSTAWQKRLILLLNCSARGYMAPNGSKKKKKKVQPLFKWAEVQSRQD